MPATSENVMFVCSLVVMRCRLRPKFPSMPPPPPTPRICRNRKNQMNAKISTHGISVSRTFQNNSPDSSYLIRAVQRESQSLSISFPMPSAG